MGGKDTLLPPTEMTEYCATCGGGGAVIDSRGNHITCGACAGVGEFYVDACPTCDEKLSTYEIDGVPRCKNCGQAIDQYHDLESS